jgi:hypothetical protein
MSALSSLEAQLSAVNGDSGGVSFASSKRHVESVGRGLQYSVLTGTNSTSVTPSALYPTSAEAAAVPLRIVKEQCVAALQQLSLYESTVDSSLQREDDSPSLPQQEQSQFWLGLVSTLTETVPSKEVMSSLLVRLSVIFAEDDSMSSTAALHILEYMIRTCAVHQTHVLDLVYLALASVHEKPALFHRLLQLVDLTQNEQHGASLLWLRPYVVATAPTASAPVVPNRTTVVSRHFLQHARILLRQACQWIQTAVKQQCSGQSSTYVGRRGLARIISYTAALIVEGLHQVVMSSSAKQDLEEIAGVLMPYGYAAVQSTCKDFRHWGYIVASTLAEYCTMTPATLEAWTKHIVEGVLGSSSPGSVVSSSYCMESAADAITVIISVIVTPRSQQGGVQIRDSTKVHSSDPQYESYRYLLPLLMDEREGHHQSKPQPFLGCVGITPGIVTTLVNRIPSFGDLLGHLHVECQIQVLPLLTSLIVAACLGDIVSVPIAQSLIRCTDLQSLWQKATAFGSEKTRSSLAKFVAGFIVQRCIATESSAEKEAMVDRLRSILLALHEEFPAQCEAGIALGLGSLASSDIITPERCEKNSSSIWLAHQNELKILLNGIVPGERGDASESGDGHDPMLSSDTWSTFVPPRVALEHAQSHVRLQAIEQLLQAIRRGEDTDVSDENGENLLESLLRRWCTDTDRSVSFAAGSAVRELAFPEHLEPPVLDLVLTGTCRWILQEEFETKRILDTLSIVGMVTQHRVSPKRSPPFRWFMLLELVFVLLEHGEAQVEEHAGHALLSMLGEDCGSPKRRLKKEKDRKVVSAKKFIVKNEGFVRYLFQEPPASVSQLAAAAQSVRVRTLFLLLRASVDFSEESCLSPIEAIALCENLAGCHNPKQTNDVQPVVALVLEKVFSRFQLMDDAKSCFDALVATNLHLQLHSFLREVLRSPVLALATRAEMNNKEISCVAQLLEYSVAQRANPSACELYIFLAQEILVSGADSSGWKSFVPALALLSSTNSRVRSAAASFLEHLGPRLPKSFESLKVIGSTLSRSKSSIALAKSSFVADLLSQSITLSGNASLFRRQLLELGLSYTCGRDSSAFVTTTGRSNETEIEIPFFAAGEFLDALELAGEGTFPLSLRWKNMGSQLFREIEKMELTGGVSKDLSKTVDSVIRMMKGVVVRDARLVISSGPQLTGGRRRSYSLGNLEGLSIVDSYPETMIPCIVDGLSGVSRTGGSRTLTSAILHHIIESKSWVEGVFVKLSRKDRQKVCCSVVQCILRDDMEVARWLLTELALDSTDLASLLDYWAEKQEWRALTLVTEYIRYIDVNSSNKRDDLLLIRRIFDLVAILSAERVDDMEASGYARDSLLYGLEALCLRSDLGKIELEVSVAELTKWAKTIVLLVTSAHDPSEVLPAVSHRTYLVALRLLTLFTSRWPVHFVPHVIPVLVSAAKLNEETRSDVVAGDAFVELVPTYCAHALTLGLTPERCRRSLTHSC